MQIISSQPKPSSFCSKASAQPLPRSQAFPEVWHSLWQKASFAVIPMVHRGPQRPLQQGLFLLGSCASGRCSKPCTMTQCQGRVPCLSRALHSTKSSPSAPESWVSALSESLTFYLSRSTDFTIWLVFIRLQRM